MFCQLTQLKPIYMNLHEFACQDEVENFTKHQDSWCPRALAHSEKCEYTHYNGQSILFQSYLASMSTCNYDKLQSFRGVQQREATETMILNFSHQLNFYIAEFWKQYTRQQDEASSTSTLNPCHQRALFVMLTFCLTVPREAHMHSIPQSLCILCTK